MQGSACRRIDKQSMDKRHRKRAVGHGLERDGCHGTDPLTGVAKKSELRHMDNTGNVVGVVPDHEIGRKKAIQRLNLHAGRP